MRRLNGAPGAVLLALLALVACVTAFVALSTSKPKVADAGATLGFVSPSPTPRGYVPPTSQPSATASSASSASSGSSTSTGTQPVSLWIGDEYTAGVGASSVKQGAACLTAAALNWNCQVDAVSSSGYLAGSKPISTRLAADKAAQPGASLVILDAGRNDGETATPALQAAITSTFNTVASSWPNATVVVIEPYLITSTAPDAFLSLRKFIAEQATARSWTVIDPIGSGWITAAAAAMVSDNGITPNPAGHQYLAGKLAAALQPVASKINAPR